MRRAIRFFSELLHRLKLHVGPAKPAAKLRLLLVHMFAVGYAAAIVAQLSAPAAAAPVFRPAQPLAGAHGMPPYPSEAILAGHEGLLRLRLTVAADGRVGNVQIEKSSENETLDAPTAKWIESHWRFQPATLDGKPVTSVVSVEIRFVLQPIG